MPYPLLYEINTRCWLRELSEQQGHPVTLDAVPESYFLEWGRLGFTHVWLMGVWTSGPRVRAEALKHPQLRATYDQVLPGWTEADVPGSPYAIADYQVSPALGGEAGLRSFRRKLQTHGIELLLDFVPNHLGLDHPWLSQQPDLFVQSPAPVPGTFPQQTAAGTRWLAHGKDPYFPPWTDTVQLDYRSAATRAAMTDLLKSVAARCDGVRCDMAMLLLSDIFARTWDGWPRIEGPGVDPSEFWSSAIASVKQAYPDFLFLAEAYWGLEGRLQALGFDYTYDKTLYDGLVARDAAAVQRHLSACTPQYIAASAHFLENHDEPRIASILTLSDHPPAALLILGLPGLRFLHEGQLTGARLRIPVQLARRPAEPPQREVEQLYTRLLATLPSTAVGGGAGRLLQPRSAWPDNPTWQAFIIVQWQCDARDFDLVVVNLAPHRSQCYAALSFGHAAGSSTPPAHSPTTAQWSLKDLLGAEQYTRPELELISKGLYLDLPAYGAQLFHFAPVAAESAPSLTAAATQKLASAQAFQTAL